MQNINEKPGKPTGDGLPNVRITDLSELRPDPGNANRGTERGVYLLEESVQQCGLGRSLLVDRNGVLIAGNKTAEAAAAAGISRVIEVETEGDAVVVVKRRDLDLLADPRARKLATFDNRAGEVSLNWDPTALLADLEEGVDYSDLFFRDEISRLAEGDGTLIPDSLLLQFPERHPAPATGQSTGGELVVKGEPTGKNSAVSAPPPPAPPGGMQAVSTAPLRIDLQADGEQVAFPGGGEALEAQTGLSLELTAGGPGDPTTVIITATAGGAVNIYVGRGSQDLLTWEVDGTAADPFAEGDEDE